MVETRDERIDKMTDELMTLAKSEGERIRLETGGSPKPAHAPNIDHLLRANLRKAIVAAFDRGDFPKNPKESNA